MLTDGCSIDLLQEIKTFKSYSGKERDIAFQKIFDQFLPLVYTLLRKLSFKLDEKEKAIQFIRIQLFEILNERSPLKRKGKLVRDKSGNIIMRSKNRIRLDDPKQLTKYIHMALDKRVNKDNFRFYASDSHLLRSVWVAQYCFRNAKKRFMQKYKKEPELTSEPDLKEFTKIYSGKTSVKKQNEVLTIAANLNNSIESLEKKISFDNKSGEFRLADILQAENENVEQDCIQQKNREVLIKEIESILSHEQANLVKLYFRLSTTEELTKEEIANKLGWTRTSRLYGVVPNTSKVKNSLNKSKEILKQNPAFRALLMNSI
jgi:hypothetical protein